MKFTLSYEKRKALNEWAIANKIHSEIPKFFNRKWLDNKKLVDKNAFYEYILAQKKEKDDKAEADAEKERNKGKSDRDYIINLEVELEVQFEGRKKKYVKKYPISRLVKKGADEEEEEEDMVTNLIMEIEAYGRGIEKAVFLSKRASRIEIQNAGDNKKIKMKEAHALPIDGHESQEWDTKTGKCVFD